jgi:hypothetical protein
VGARCAQAQTSHYEPMGPAAPAAPEAPGPASLESTIFWAVLAVVLVGAVLALVGWGIYKIATGTFRGAASVFDRWDDAGEPAGPRFRFGLIDGLFVCLVIAWVAATILLYSTLLLLAGIIVFALWILCRLLWIVLRQPPAE